MKDIFDDLFTHNFEANRRILTVVRAHDNLPEKINDICSHLLLAHRIWLNRMCSEPPEDTLQPWDKVAVGKYIELNEKLLSDTLDKIQATGYEKDFDKIIYYSNSKGERFRNSIKEIFFHVLTHSAYHRGQINQMLRQNDVEPQVTDYIFYKRENQA